MWSDAGAKFFSLKPNMILARQRGREGGRERGGKGRKKEGRRRRKGAPETFTLKFRKNMEKVRKVKERVKDMFKRTGGRLLGNRERREKKKREREEFDFRKEKKKQRGKRRSWG